MMGRVIFLAFVLVAFSSPACGMTLQPDKSGDFKKTVEEIAAIAREAASEAIEEGLEEVAKGVIREGLEPSVGVGTAMSVITSLARTAFLKYHQRRFLKQVRKVDSKSAARDIWLDVAFILTEDPKFNPLNETYCKKYSTAGASSLYNACILNRVTVGRVMSACGAEKKSKCTREEIISRYTAGHFCSDCNCCQNEDSKVGYFEKIQELYADTVKVILSNAIPDPDKTQTVRVQLYLEYAIRRPPITKDIFKEETNKLKLAREKFGITDSSNRRLALGSKLTEIMNADVTEQLKKRLDRK